MPSENKKNPRLVEPSAIEKIKKLVIIAMFSNDEMMEHLVLKGGNALDLVYQVSTRASVDVDFSMRNDFPGGIEALKMLIRDALETTFRDAGYQVFDLKVEDKPENLSPDVAEFWGGYAIEFKLIELEKYKSFSEDIEELRRNALLLGRGSKFLIDVSKLEYTDGKEPTDLDGYRIFVYSAAMIVCEKLRAICQQMPDYGPIVKRNRPGSPRARDFIDIHTLMTKRKIQLGASDKELLREMFHAKRVPLSFLGQAKDFRDFHRTEFPAVQASVKAGVTLQNFDFYFDFVIGLIDELEPVWNK